MPDSATATDVDPRARYRALQDALSALGATVALQDLDALPTDTVTDMCDDLAARLRAIREGQRSGWTAPDA